MTNSLPSPHEAAQELLKRRRARCHLLDFTTYTFPSYLAEAPHALIADTLDQVIGGEIKRLMIFAPPQHGKSELASVRLPAYWLGRRPNDPVILSSYAASLSYNKSRQARAIVEGTEFERLFRGINTRKDSRAVDHWELAPPLRGNMLAVGVGGPITGHGALLGIIDDPFENWEQAQSMTIRNKIWDWYRTTFRTRIWEEGVIVLIMTRWHEDDLAGRLLLDQSDKWHILRLPAIAESQEERDENNRRMGLASGEADPLGRAPGEPLCPKRFSLAALLELKNDVGSLGWSSEYQGAPRAPEGNRFKRDWFSIVETGPAVAKRVRYWDNAATQDGGKFTAGVLMAMNIEGLIYVENVVRGQWSSHQRQQIMKQTADIDSQRYDNSVTIWVEQEPGSSGVDSVQDTIRRLNRFPVRADKVTGDKDVRLEPFAAQAEAGNVKLVRGAWNGDYIDEMCAIPNSAFRDQADASGGAYSKLSDHRSLRVMRYRR